MKQKTVMPNCKLAQDLKIRKKCFEPEIQKLRKENVQDHPPHNRNKLKRKLTKLRKEMKEKDKITSKMRNKLQDINT